MLPTRNDWRLGRLDGNDLHITPDDAGHHGWWQRAARLVAVAQLAIQGRGHVPQVVSVACWQVCQSSAIDGPPALALMSEFCSFRYRPTPVTVPPVPTPAGPRGVEGHAICPAPAAPLGAAGRATRGRQVRDGGGCWSRAAGCTPNGPCWSRAAGRTCNEDVHLALACLPDPAFKTELGRVLTRLQQRPGSGGTRYSIRRAQQVATVWQQHMPPGSCRPRQVSPGPTAAVQSTRWHSQCSLHSNRCHAYGSTSCNTPFLLGPCCVEMNARVARVLKLQRINNAGAR